MRERKEFVVGGFQFGNAKDAETARNEVQKIELLENRMDYGRPEQVNIIYEKAIQNRVFQTPVGLRYLCTLQDFLKEHPIENPEVKNIPLYMNYSKVVREKAEPAKKRIEPKEAPEDPNVVRYKKSLFINILLGLMVVAMFAITFTGKNPNILNYENKIINRYAEWEQELSQRESTVKEKERELGITK